MHVLELLAEAFLYPAPGRELELRRLLAGQSGPAGDRVSPPPVAVPETGARAARSALERFTDEIEQLDLGAWEELYTRTFDLNPPSAPYLGYQVWGDKYQRGELLAELGRRQKDAGVEMEGELPDHLVPVLRYLAATPEPLPGLLQIVAPALRKMRAGVENLDSASPYLPVLDAVLTCAPGVARPSGDCLEAQPGPADPGLKSIQLTMSCHPDLTRRDS